MFLYLIPKYVFLYGFGNDSLKSRFLHCILIFGIIPAGDRNRRSGNAGEANLSKQIISVHIGQTKIQEEKLVLAPRNQFEGCLAAGSLPVADIPSVEQGTYIHSVYCFIFGDENHAATF